MARLRGFAAGLVPAPARSPAKPRSFACPLLLPARYCAGDVAGERGGRAVVLGAVRWDQRRCGRLGHRSRSAERLRRAYSPDVELRTLASGIGTGVSGSPGGWTAWFGTWGSGWDPSANITSSGSTTSRLAIGLSFPPGSGVSGARAALGPSLSSCTPTSCATARSCGSISTTPWNKPSKPPPSRSRRVICIRRTSKFSLTFIT